jgi:hypothetical protein
MAYHHDPEAQHPGALLNKMLAGHRMFLENVYSLMRFLETQLGKGGWTLVKLGGVYGVTRNGLGSGLASFTKADWVTNHAGIAFVRPESTSSGPYGATITHIRQDGLQVCVFQVRWLDKSPHEPVVWHVKLQVDRSKPESDDAWSAKKWEDYQTDVFRKLERDGFPGGAPSGTVKSGTVAKGGAEIVFTGQYMEVPVSSILTQEDALALLVVPAHVNSHAGA